MEHALLDCRKIVGLLKYCMYCREDQTAGRRGEMLKYCVYCLVDQTVGKREIVKYFVCYQVDIYIQGQRRWLHAVYIVE